MCMCDINVHAIFSLLLIPTHVVIWGTVCLIGTGYLENYTINSVYTCDKQCDCETL